MNLSYVEWVTINERDDMTNEILNQAISDLGKTIDSLDVLQGDVGVYRLTIIHLTARFIRLNQIKHKRTPTRPALGSRVDLYFKNEELAFYGLPGGPYGIRANEQTEQLRALIETVYEAAVAMSVEL